MVAAFTHEYRATQATGKEERLVAEFFWRSIGINLENSLRFASITARKNVEWDAALLQQLSEQNHKRSLSRTANGQVAHADHWTVQSLRLQRAAIVQAIPASYEGRIHSAQWVQAVCASCSREESN